MSSSRRLKLDALDWPVQMKLLAFGVRLQLRCDNEACLPELLDLLPPGWADSRGTKVDRTYSILGPGAEDQRIYADGRLLRSPGNGYSVLDAFENDAQMFVAEHAPRRVFVHAGVVALHNKAVLIPGLSFSGKSTLTTALLRAGATYYSDEYAVLDAKGRVHPYARPLSLRPAGQVRGERYEAEELGFKIGRTALPVKLVVVTRYRSGHEWKPKQLTAGQGALALLANTVAGRTYPERVLPVLRTVAADALFLGGTRGEAEEAVIKITSQLDRTLS